MSYYSYHCNIKKKIKESHCTEMLLVDKYKYISPCLIIKTDTNIYPIREYRWQEYFDIASNLGIEIEDRRN